MLMRAICSAVLLLSLLESGCTRRPPDVPEPVPVPAPPPAPAPTPPPTPTAPVPKSISDAGPVTTTPAREGEAPAREATDAIGAFTTLTPVGELPVYGCRFVLELLDWASAGEVCRSSTRSAPASSRATLR